MSMIYIHWGHEGQETLQTGVTGEAWDDEGRKLVLTLEGGATIEFGPNEDAGTYGPENDYDTSHLPRGQLVDLIPFIGPAIVANYTFYPPSPPEEGE